MNETISTFFKSCFEAMTMFTCSSASPLAPPPSARPTLAAEDLILFRAPPVPPPSPPGIVNPVKAPPRRRNVSWTSLSPSTTAQAGCPLNSVPPLGFGLEEASAYAMAVLNSSPGSKSPRRCNKNGKLRNPARNACVKTEENHIVKFEART